MQIRPLGPDDWPAIKEIYELGIATGLATFEDDVPGWEDWNGSRLPFGRLVATVDQQVVAWAVLSPVSKRAAYAGVAEITLYVHPAFKRRGIGQSLLETCVANSEQNGIWTLNAVIFSENTGSIRLFEKAGFRKVGYRERIARKNGIWKDTILMERRSSSVGNP